ncbi:hypothetical protein Pint_15732 [Pistacia integerrima]|uniref:Uncharacterized protein n=1 Tax=Pistacia integerrima TaxID=434235 RepID=A0ACC0ZE97_9ROSI|nr:hypothetical protein Pint_15732 [Pistacia integerrima]
MLKALVDIKLFVEAIHVESIKPLQALPEPNPREPTHEQSKIPLEECCEDEFHWSDAYDDDDENENHNVNGISDGNGEGNVGIEGNVGTKGDVFGGNKDKKEVENRGMLSDYESNNEDIIGSRSSEDDDLVS